MSDPPSRHFICPSSLWCHQQAVVRRAKLPRDEQLPATLTEHCGLGRSGDIPGIPVDQARELATECLGRHPLHQVVSTSSVLCPNQPGIGFKGVGESRYSCDSSRQRVKDSTLTRVYVDGYSSQHQQTGVISLNQRRLMGLTG